MTPPQFSLVPGQGTSIVATAVVADGFCVGDQQVEPGGSLSCTVAFDIALNSTLTAVRFLDAELSTSVIAEVPSDVMLSLLRCRRLHRARVRRVFEQPSWRYLLILRRQRTLRLRC